MASRKDDRGRVLKTGESQRKSKNKGAGATGETIFYEYRYKDPVSGKRVSVYKSTLQELREEEKKIQAMLDASLDIQRGNRTLSNQMDYFLGTKCNLREGSRKTYQTAINTIKSSAIGQTKIAKISVSAVKNVCISWYTQGLSRRYTQLCYTLMKNAMQMAYEDGALVKNPCMFKLSSILPENEDTPKSPINKQEKENLLLMLEKSKNPKDKFYYHVVLILCETGLRIGEFRGLREGDVNFEKMEINIHHQLSRQGTYVVPKTKRATRKIPMTERVVNSMRFLIDRAKKIRAQNPTNSEYAGCNDFIMLSEKGIPVDYFAYARAFKRFEKEYKEHCGEEIDVTPHVCRHTFASNCVAGKIPPKSLQQLMGHSSFQISMDTYTELEYDVVRDDFMMASGAL